MSPATLLRILIAAEITLALASVAVESAVPDLLPALLEHYVERRIEEPMSQIEIVAAAIMVPGILSWIGLWQLKPWGRQVYTGVTVLAVALTPFLGPMVSSAISGLLVDLSVACGGAILVLIWYSPLREYFGGERGSSDRDPG